MEMVLERVGEDRARGLYGYCQGEMGGWPFWFDTPYEAWADSMFRDADVDGDRLFAELETVIAVRGGAIAGYVQFGITAYALTEAGKDFDRSYAIVRSLYCGQGDAAAGRALLAEADGWFASRGRRAGHAFFHWFGMSCHGHMGKLPHAGLYLEPTLRRFGYVAEHENLLYIRRLTDGDTAAKEGVACAFGKAAGGLRRFDLTEGGEHLGWGEVEALPQGGVAYLRLIFVDEGKASRGVGGRCMRALLRALRREGYAALATDTAGDNLIAQGYYLKCGFAHAGIARSYARAGA